MEVGSGYDVLAGGAIGENLGGSYELGANIGNIVGGTIRSFAYGKLTPRHNAITARTFSSSALSLTIFAVPS